MSDNLRSLLTSLPPLPTVRQRVLRERDAWLQRRIVTRHHLPLYRLSSQQRLYNELAAIDLLRRLQESDDAVRTAVYPAGGAAGYGLLYLLARALSDYGFQRVLELGVGQSTALLDRYAAVRGASVLSLEDDPGWADTVRQRSSAPSHRIVTAPLRAYSSATAGAYRWYDLDGIQDVPAAGVFDLILVDGPVGTSRFSRVGIVDAFDRLRAGEFLVIWDDLDRTGDLETFAAFMQQERAKGVSVECAFLVGMKTVGLTYTPEFRGVRFYV